MLPLSLSVRHEQDPQGLPEHWVGKRCGRSGYGSRYARLSGTAMCAQVWGGPCDGLAPKGALDNMGGHSLPPSLSVSPTPDMPRAASPSAPHRDWCCHYMWHIFSSKSQSARSGKLGPAGQHGARKALRALEQPWKEAL